eukprot:jgi/Picre1/27139/NNA_000108.t1
MHRVPEVQLSVEAGKTMALVGESGSGKSTCVLIEGFTPVDGGSFWTAKTSRPQPALAAVQRGSVSQSGAVQHERATTSVGRPSELEQVEEAARAANAHQFIQLCRGYSTMLGGLHPAERGQKQRIDRRAIVKTQGSFWTRPRQLGCGERACCSRVSLMLAAPPSSWHTVCRRSRRGQHRFVYKGHIVEQGSHDS